MHIFRHIRWLSIMTTALVYASAAHSQSPGEPHTVAYFASSAQNGYNQAVYEGIEKQAAKLGIETAIFDGQFDATLQYSQVEDVLASKKFDGFVIMANDTVGISGAVEQIAAAGYPVSTVLFPIGPDLNALKPQVRGLTASFIYPPADGARKQAESVVAFCANKTVCNVAILVGFKAAPFDNLRLEVYRQVLGSHDNIKVVAEMEGQYSPDVSLAAMQDVLQAHPELDALLSTADQQVVGAEIAMKSANIDETKIFISSVGATEAGVEAVRQGRWANTYLHLPRTMGELALGAVVAAIKKEPFQSEVNMEKQTKLPPLLTREVLEMYPEFKAEWLQ